MIKKSVLAVFASLFLLGNTHAEIQQFVREHTYLAGEADSNISSRQNALQEVKNALLNEIGTHIYSRINIHQGKAGISTTSREIQALTAGFVKVEVIEENWDGYRFYIKAKLEADADDIGTKIRQIIDNDKGKDSLSQHNKALKQRLLESHDEEQKLRNELAKLREKLQSAKFDQQKIELGKQYSNTIQQVFAHTLVQQGIDHYLGINGKSKDYVQAKKTFLQAAQSESALAQLYLGFIYSQDTEVEQDYSQAAFWFRKAAQQGDATAQFKLANIYINGLGTPKNPKQAAYWMEKSAQQGVADSQYTLARFYINGFGVGKDQTRAVEWIMKAAHNNHREAQNILAYLYESGAPGLKKNLNKTIYWHRKAASQNETDSQFELGLAYEHGTGVTKDLGEAIAWYRRSANLGNQKATARLKILDQD